MSATIDQRVVEMRFDNKQFERGVSDTMSTLDKLKQKLNFNGAVKGVDSVNTAAKGVNANMSSLGGAVETVSMKFSALQIMGVTALTRLTNSAIDAGIKIAKALTIDPVTSGFREYETQINAVQTILANTSHAGTTIDDVNKALEELNTYADQTIYNFTEMTRNIGTFTAAGINLDTSVSAIKGIANLAAVSGSTSQQASTAMYQLSQALAAGRVSLMDWNSVVNAGMGGKVFQDALTRTADVMNKGAGSSAIKKYGSFRESLTKGEWLTVDVLTETLNQFTMAAEEGSAEWEKYKASLKEKGYTDAQATEILKMANTATDAATKVKTFTQLWDVLKESAQSGWAQTWKLIVGDFEEAKSLLTPIADALVGMINRMSDFRNKILQSALGRTFASLGDKFDTILKPAAKVGEVVDKVGMSLEELDKIADKVIRGNFGNGKERFDKLTEAGINYYRVQNRVNEKLNDGFRHSQEKIEAQDKLLGIQSKSTEQTKEQGDAVMKLTAEQKAQLIQMSALSDAELKRLEYTDEEIKALRELEKVADSLGISFASFLNNLDKINGRWLLINSFKNIGKGLADVGKAIGQAWKEVFPEHSVEHFANKLFDLLGTFHRITAAMTNVFYKRVGTNSATGEAIYELTEAGEKLVRTFKGVFAIIDIVTTLVGGVFKFAFKVVAEIFGRFGLSILDVTAVIGDTIVAFRDWLDSIFNVSKAVDVLMPLVKGTVKLVKKLITAVKNSKWFNNFCEYVERAAEGLGNLFTSIPNMDAFHKLVKVLKDAGKAVKDWFKGLRDAENIPGYIIQGLVKGIIGGVPEVIGAVFELAKSIISGICDVLGIHSPAVEMIKLGQYISEGLAVGIVNGKDRVLASVENVTGGLWGAMKKALLFVGDRIRSLLTGIWEAISTDSGHIDWTKLFAGGMLAGLVYALVLFAKAAKGVADGIGGIGDILENTGIAIKKFGKVLDAYAWDLKAKALLKLAISIAILAGIAWLMMQLGDWKKIAGAVGIIIILAGILVGMAFAMSKLNDASVHFDKKNGLDINGLKSGLLGIAVAIGILALVVKMIGEMDPDEAKAGFKGLIGIAIGIVAFFGIIKLLSKVGGDTSGLGKMMLGLTIALGVMAFVVKLISGMDPEDVFVGVLLAREFLALMFAMAAINRLCGTKLGEGESFKGVSGAIMGMSFAMLMMAGVIAIVSRMDPEKVALGVLFVQAFLILILEMALMNKFLGTKLGKEEKFKGITGAIMSMSFALLLMAGVVKILSTLSKSDVIKGTVVIQAFLLLILEMLLISKLGKDAEKVGDTIMSMAVSIGILALIAVLLSMVDTSALVKGITAVGALSLLMAIMGRSLKGAQNAKGAIMWMAIGVGILAASVYALSFIPTKKAIPIMAGLSLLVLSFGAMMKLASKVKADVKSLLMMMGVVVVLAGVIVVLSKLNASSAIEAVASISILMVALAATMQIASKAGSFGKSGLKAMVGMAAIAAVLGLVVGLLEKFDLTASIDTAISLSVLIGALAAALIPIAAAGKIGGATGLQNGLIALAELVGGAVAIFVVVGGVMEYLPFLEDFLDKGIPVLEKVASGIGSFVGNLISGFAKGLTDGLPGIMQNLTEAFAYLPAISAAASTVKPGSLSGVSDFVAMLMEISLGAIIEEVAGWITGESSVEKFKQGMLDFITAATEISAALDGVTIDETAIKTLTDCGNMFSALNNSLPKEGGIVQAFTGEADFSGFAEDCKSFTKAMIEVNTAVSAEGFDFKKDRIELLIEAGQKFADLTGAVEKTGGLVQEFTGTADFTKFNTDFASFIATMTAINVLLSADTFDFKKDRIEMVIEAGQKFADLTGAVEKTGGLVQEFTGTADFTKFNTDCDSFVKAMIEINKLVSGDDFSLDLDAIQLVTDAGTKFTDLANALPKTGGIWQDIAGEKDIEDFGNKVVTFTEAMVDTGTTASDIDHIAIIGLLNTAVKIRDFFLSVVAIDDSVRSSVMSVFSSKEDSTLYVVAKAITGFGGIVNGINTEAVKVSVDAALKLRDLISNLAGVDTSGIENFKPESIGTAMKEYGDNVDGIDPALVASSIASAERLKVLIQNLAGIDTSGVGQFKQAISDLASVDTGGIVSTFSGAVSSMAGIGGDMIDGLISGMSSRKLLLKLAVGGIISGISSNIGEKEEDFEDAGSDLMSNLKDGISDEEDPVCEAVSEVVAAAAEEAESGYSDFYDAGAYLVSGFSAGIDKNTFSAVAMAKAMANAAEEAARKALGINSPSRVFKEIGSGVPEGFALGIRKMTSLIDAPLNSMSSVAMKSVSDTVSRIATAIDSDMDVQPTIRPVLDLSNIRSGSGAISSMLGAGSSVGVLGAMGSISRSMNSRSQNVSNADVVSAIDRLDKHLDNVGNTTYTIGGITYDDGSNIANTIKDLTRYARMERRV